MKTIFTENLIVEAQNVGETPGKKGRSSIRGISVASQFRSSLQTLVSDLEETMPHYIRCLKPNLKKSPNSFDPGEVLRQLRYAGMMEAIRIRREGYALREGHESFYDRFHMLLNSEDLQQGEGIAHLVMILSKRLNVTDIDWQIGHSKIFLRRELACKLETLVSIRVVAAARVIGRFGRFVAERRASSLLTAWGLLCVHRLRKRRKRVSATKIQSVIRGRTQRSLFMVMLISVIKLQSCIRRYQAIRRFQRLCDPYSHLSFQEVEVLFHIEQSRLEGAVSEKDFALAADLEKKL
jgi:myosin heavy subunit